MSSCVRREDWSSLEFFYKKVNFALDLFGDACYKYKTGAGRRY